MTTRHYLDHAATTPPRAVALEAYVRAAGLANASSLHADGRAARSALEGAREEIAALVDAAPAEVVFTSGGTEADNLGVLGAARSRLAAGLPTRVLVSAAEHHSVLDAAEQAGREGARVVVLPVTPDGALSVPALRAALAASPGAVGDDAGGAPDAGTRSVPGEGLVVAAMLANNEIGTLTDLPPLAALVSAAGGHLHADAVQAAGHVPLSFADSGAASMSLSGHKFGAPMGIGALLVRRDASLVPLGFGGGQERDLRSGSVDVPGAVAMAAALREACEESAAESARLARLRDTLVAGIRTAVPDARLLGPPLEEGGDRLPGLANLVFPGRVGESMITLLDVAGISCSTGSACTAGVAEASHVAIALGESREDAGSVLRFSLGRTSTEEDVAAVVRAVPEVAARARRSGVTGSRLRPGR